MNNLLELKNINKSYQTKTLNTLALNDISLAVKEGDFISICGPSGGCLLIRSHSVFPASKRALANR